MGFIIIKDENGNKSKIIRGEIEKLVSFLPFSLKEFENSLHEIKFSTTSLSTRKRKIYLLQYRNTY